MRTKDPKDMNTALNMLTNDFQLETHSRTHTHFQHKNIPQQSQQHKQKQNLHTQHRQTQHPQLTYRPIPPTNQIFKPNNNQFPTNQQFRKPFNSQYSSNQNSKPNNQSQQNVFRPNPNYKAPKPTPMSICTRQTMTPRATSNPYRPQQFFHAQNRPNYIAEELFTTEINNYAEPEIDDQGTDYSENELNPNYYVTEPDQNDQDEFFPTLASEQTLNL